MRERVVEVVKKHIAECLEDVDLATLDTSLSLKDYGINSLDMVEIVSRSMRELKVKVSRTELNKVRNIDGLIDLLQGSVPTQQEAKA
jgi:acyl carrier protein